MINLSKSEVRLIQEHGSRGSANHVSEIEVTPKGMPRRKAFRLILPFAVLSLTQFDFAKKLNTES